MKQLSLILAITLIGLTTMSVEPTEAHDFDSSIRCVKIILALRALAPWIPASQFYGRNFEPISRDDLLFALSTLESQLGQTDWSRSLREGLESKVSLAVGYRFSIEEGPTSVWELNRSVQEIKWGSGLLSRGSAFLPTERNSLKSDLASVPLSSSITVHLPQSPYINLRTRKGIDSYFEQVRRLNVQGAQAPSQPQVALDSPVKYQLDYWALAESPGHGSLYVVVRSESRPAFASFETYEADSMRFRIYEEKSQLFNLEALRKPLSPFEAQEIVRNPAALHLGQAIVAKWGDQYRELVVQNTPFGANPLRFLFKNTKRPSGSFFESASPLSGVFRFLPWIKREQKVVILTPEQWSEFVSVGTSAPRHAFFLANQDPWDLYPEVPIR